MAFKAVAAVLLVACLLASSSADDAPVERIVGSTVVLLDHIPCKFGECSLSNCLTASMLDEYVQNYEHDIWTRASIAVTNAGATRASITEYNRPGGMFTYDDLRVVLPWNNTIDIIEIQGRTIMEALEHSATKVGRNGFLHWGGLRVRYDLTAPVNSRVKCVSVLCRLCRVPRFEPINLDTWYWVTINDYIFNGGDGYTMFLPNSRYHFTGRIDVDVFIAYSAKRSPITQGLDERVDFLN